MRHVKEYDGLRGLMALWVLFGHWTTAILIHLPGVPANLSNTSAVDVFIILSGFAIATLNDRRREPYGAYILRRALRIFPVYWFYLIISILMAGLSLQVWSNAAGGAMRAPREEIAVAALSQFWPNVLAHIPALHSLVPDRFLHLGEFAFLGQAWSISLEWQFYLVAPFAIAALLAATRSWMAALALSIVLVALAYAGRWLPMGFVGSHSAHFALGIGTYYLLKWHSGWDADREQVIGAVAMLIVGAVLLLKIPSALPLSIWAIATAAAMAPTLWPFSLLSRLLLAKPVQSFGMMSYSVYLSHMIWLTLGLYGLQQAQIVSPLPHAAILLVVTLAGTLVSSTLSFRYVEQPFQQLGKRLASPRQPALSPAAE